MELIRLRGTRANMCEHLRKSPPFRRPSFSSPSTGRGRRAKIPNRNRAEWQHRLPGRVNYVARAQPAFLAMPAKCSRVGPTYIRERLIWEFFASGFGLVRTNADTCGDGRCPAPMSIY